MYKKGDVVLVLFPHENNGKRRPGVVVSVEEIDEETADVLLVPLTSNSTKIASNDKRIRVTVDSPEGKRGGVRIDSSIDCSFLAKVPGNLIVGKIGSFSANIVGQIEKHLEESDHRESK